MAWTKTVREKNTPYLLAIILICTGFFELKRYASQWMYQMKNIALVILLLIPYNVQAEEVGKEDMSAITDLMIVAKATGMCGVYRQMAIFQESTKMSGGNEFILRFLNTEAARLGHTPESFMQQCAQVTEKYNNSMKLLGFEQ